MYNKSTSHFYYSHYYYWDIGKCNVSQAYLSNCNGINNDDHVPPLVKSPEEETRDTGLVCRLCDLRIQADFK